MALVILCCLAAPCAAQLPIVSNTIADHRVFVTFGWDPVWVGALGYSRALRDFIGQNDAAFDIVVTVPPRLLAGLGAWKIAAGVTALFVGSSDVGSTAGVHTSLAHTRDDTGTKLAWGAALVLQPGYYGDGWAIAADGGWRGALATYMKHSQAIRDLFGDRYGDAANGSNDGPRDGWYRFTANRLCAGLVGGGGGQTLAFFGAGGFEYTIQRQGILASPQLGQLPFYLDAGAVYRSNE